MLGMGPQQRVEWRQEMWVVVHLVQARNWQKRNAQETGP